MYICLPLNVLESMEISFYGHSAFQLDFAGKSILVDPFISPNPAASAIDISALQPDIILLTHGHADHVADAKAIADQSGAQIISTYEVYEWCTKQELNARPLNHGGKADLGWCTIKCVAAVHSSTMPDGSSGGSAAGFVLWTNDKCIYIAGDTALTMDMQLIPLICPKLDLAILPVGDTFTMGYDDAVLAADFVKCDRVIGCHFDTFPPISIDKDAARKLFAENGKELILLDIGASYTV